MSYASPADAEPSLSALSLNPTKAARRPAATSTPDSWEEDDSSNATTPTSATPSRPTHDLPSAPPPTPITPSVHAGDPSLPARDTSYGAHSPNAPSADVAEPLTPLRGRFRPADSDSGPSGLTSPGAVPDVRPDKSSTAAARMIAGALGVRRPKESDDSKAYERALRDRERNRVEMEKDARRRAERERNEAQRAVWED